MIHKTRDQHLFDDGPKRILALDGGGIRGALTLGYLSRIESILRERNGDDPEFRLCDYFDLIGGTSTGSIIATGLALGFSVEKLTDIYRALGEEVFESGFLRFGVFSAKFPTEPLERALRAHFGDETLGSEKLRTGLMVMTKRLDTGSPWLLHNNPRGKYYGVRESGGAPNRDLLLRKIVRASTAAPHFFEPELLKVSDEVCGAFVDGGVSPYNNPAMQMLMLATCSGYGLNWAFGADRLLLVSAGTGHLTATARPEDVMKMPAVLLAAQSMLSIMEDANWLGQAVLQWMGRSATGWNIDGEIGDLASDSLGGGPAMITYQRYDVALQSDWLRETLGMSFSEKECAALYAMDDPHNVGMLTSLGRTAAARQVDPSHLPTAFDI
ncbi:MAG: patatin-like phospholipase family protein [Mycobacterium sp.]|nr:patatin-like phospholipase family protein [Mycobacterium sp.]